MAAWFNVFVSWLSSVAAAGAGSWLQALAWMAALIAAGIGGISLRRNSLQSRAALLLNLYKSWEDLAEPRRDLSRFLG